MQVDAPPSDVVDAIGAGDSLGAGLLCGLLRRAPAKEALGLAGACGSLSVRAAGGGTDGQPTPSKAETLAASLSGRTASRRAG
jgi:sugar/nucleoside kinase (ribokinase family)